MHRRQALSALTASLGALRERAAAFYPGKRPHIQWCVSSFLWTSTQWQDTGTLPYTEMLDVIRDTGFKPATTLEYGIGKWVEWYRGYTSQRAGA